jgi:copper(I)-binding protein
LKQWTHSEKKMRRKIPGVNVLRVTAFTVVLTGMLSCGAVAADSVTTANAWVRATVPGQTVAGAYLDITSRARAVLIGVASPVAEKAELHTMTTDGGVMRMRAVGKIELPARQTVSLKPGGYHIMLINIRRELKAGEHIPLTLVMQDGKSAQATLTLSAEVRGIAQAAQSGNR